MSDADVVGAISQSEPTPEGFAPFYYLRQGIRILFWDTDAVARAAKDPRALAYGAVFWIVANLAVLLISIGTHRPVRLDLGIVAFVLLFLPLAAALELARIGACHAIAAWFLGGDGNFVELLRPLLLASIVLVAAAIPIGGIFLAGIPFVCVLCLAFQEVDHVEPLQSYILCIVVSLIFTSIEGTFISSLARAVATLGAGGGLSGR